MNRSCEPLQHFLMDLEWRSYFKSKNPGPLKNLKTGPKGDSSVHGAECTSKGCKWYVISPKHLPFWWQKRGSIPSLRKEERIGCSCFLTLGWISFGGFFLPAWPYCEEHLQDCYGSHRRTITWLTEQGSPYPEQSTYCFALSKLISEKAV